MKIKTAIRAAVVGVAASAAVVAGAPAASAGSNYGSVVNMSGNTVTVDCNYGHGPYHTLYEKASGKTYQSWKFSDCSDADRWRGNSDGRCVDYIGPGATDGWYYMVPGKYYKVSGLATAYVYAYTSSRCSKSREFPVT